MSSHHFVSQDVFVSSQEAAAFCSAQGKVFIATSDRRINIHDLETRGNVLHSFETVDHVQHITYCDVGNFIATLESKSMKHSDPVTYVRTYFNWWIDKGGKPMKIHIAGSTIPPSFSPNSRFEMVELPIKQTAVCIACCKKTGILAVGLSRVISVFCYTKKSEDTKQKQHDFSHFADIDMNFHVVDLKVYENLFACISSNEIQVFRIVIEKDEKQTSKDKENVPTRVVKTDNGQIDWKFESYDPEGESKLKTQLHQDSFPVTIHFKMIDEANRKFTGPLKMEIKGPVLAVKGLRTQVRLDNKAFELWPLLTSSNVDAVTLLYRQFPFTASQNKLLSLHLLDSNESEYSPSLVLDPLNAAAAQSEEGLNSISWFTFDRSRDANRNIIGCFFSNLNEGFLYTFSHKTTLVSSMKYTATLKCAALDHNFLHALTNAGLETYTLHFAHYVLDYLEKPDGIYNAVPCYDSPVCLCSVRPFLGVNRLLMSENYLVLVSFLEGTDTESEEPNCTLYALKKPGPMQAFSDLLETGHIHKSENPTAYLSVISEAHIILRSHTFLTNHCNSDHEELYLKSCILLADYYASSSNASERNLATPYYNLSKYPIHEVVQRVLGLNNQYKWRSLRPLVQYLDSVLFNENFQNGFTFNQSVSESILDTYMDESPENLWKVILLSGMVNFRLERAILMVKRRLTNKHHVFTAANLAADSLAIVYLLLKKGNINSAHNMLLSMVKVELTSILKQVRKVLWTNEGFTQLGECVKQVRPDAFVDLLVQLVDEKNVTIEEGITILQQDKNETEEFKTPLIKEFLETVMNVLDSKMSTEEELYCTSLLVGIYLQRLAEPPKIESKFLNAVRTTFLYGSRPLWLNEMPPFNGKAVSRNCAKLYKNTKNKKEDNIKMTDEKNEDEKTEKKDENKEEFCPCCTCNEDLLRLQSLLQQHKGSEVISHEFFTFISHSSKEIKGQLSLEVLSLQEKDAIKLLLEKCPTALLQFAKDNFAEDEEKWCLLFVSVRDKMADNESNNHEAFSKIFHGILAFLVEIMSIPDFIELVGDEDTTTYTPYVKRCVEKQKSRLLKQKIVDLGNEIKTMMS